MESYHPSFFTPDFSNQLNGLEKHRLLEQQDLPRAMESLLQVVQYAGQQRRGPAWRGQQLFSRWWGFVGDEILPSYMGIIIYDEPLYIRIPRWWQLKYLLFSSRSLGKWSNLTSIFFKWVETTKLFWLEQAFSVKIYLHLEPKWPLVLIEKGLVLEGWPSKIEVSWVLGICILTSTPPPLTITDSWVNVFEMFTLSRKSSPVLKTVKRLHHCGEKDRSLATPRHSPKVGEVATGPW